jgi:hypothetical protein
VNNQLYRIPVRNWDLCHYTTHSQTVSVTTSECHEFRIKLNNQNGNHSCFCHVLCKQYATACALCSVGTPFNMTMALIMQHDVTQSMSLLWQYVYTQTNKCDLTTLIASAVKVMEALKSQTESTVVRCSRWRTFFGSLFCDTFLVPRPYSVDGRVTVSRVAQSA